MRIYSKNTFFDIREFFLPHLLKNMFFQFKITSRDVKLDLTDPKLLLKTFHLSLYKLKQLFMRYFVNVEEEERQDRGAF